MSDIAHPAGAGLPDENQGPRILAATTIATGCAFITVLARVYVRLFIIRNVGLDVRNANPMTTGATPTADRHPGLHNDPNYDTGKMILWASMV